MFVGLSGFSGFHQTCSVTSFFFCGLNLSIFDALTLSRMATVVSCQIGVNALYATYARLCNVEVTPFDVCRN